jgi:hypothetical protein
MRPDYSKESDDESSQLTDDSDENDEEDDDDRDEGDGDDPRDAGHEGLEGDGATKHPAGIGKDRRQRGPRSRRRRW